MTPAELFEAAGKYLGTQEVRGKEGSNPVIEDWLLRHGKNINPNYIEKMGDDIAWCSVFIGQVCEDVGLTGTEHALAASWKTWGRPGKLTQGAVVVIRRRDRGEDGTSGRGGHHVGLFKKSNKHFIWLRGGNQRNQVSDQAFSKKNYEILAIHGPLLTS